MVFFCPLSGHGIAEFQRFLSFQRSSGFLPKSFGLFVISHQLVSMMPPPAVPITAEKKSQKEKKSIKETGLEWFGASLTENDGGSGKDLLAPA
jgi:hypothetical protein